MPAQATEIRAALAGILAVEFASELTQGWLVLNDKLHRSVGDDGVSRFGLSPNLDATWTRDVQVQTTEILIQFYGAYDLKVDRYQTVDPAAVEDVAERLKRRIRGTAGTADARSWYFNVVRTDYLDDPTGNKTRFELLVQGYGNNASLVETTG